MTQDRANEIISRYSISPKITLSLEGLFSVLFAHSIYINSKLDFYEPDILSHIDSDI